MLFLAILDKTCIDVPYIPVILLDGAFYCLSYACVTLVLTQSVGVTHAHSDKSLAASESMT